MINPAAFLIRSEQARLAQHRQVARKLMLWLSKAIHQFAQAGFFSGCEEQTRDTDARWVGQRLENLFGFDSHDMHSYMVVQ